MQELGAGAYGKVYLGKCREQSVAVKGETKSSLCFCLFVSDMFFCFCFHSVGICLFGLYLDFFFFFFFFFFPLGVAQASHGRQSDGGSSRRG
jgi:hypothetical protein